MCRADSLSYCNRCQLLSQTSSSSRNSTNSSKYELNAQKPNLLRRVYLNQISIQNNSLAAKSTATVSNVGVNRDGFLANSSAVFFLELRLRFDFCFSNLQSIPNQMLFYECIMCQSNKAERTCSLFKLCPELEQFHFVRLLGNSHIGCKRVQLQQVHLAYTQLFWTNPQIERKNSEFKTILTKRKRIQNTLKFGRCAARSTKSEVRPAHPVLGVS
ncbi:Hypothetical_protein [Hexamita inflata]|uniref:Hypothetical_protein n=1 Tax=Hexamita inflata TaxID=28002 RepID=A0ABP1HWR4_9EUKA